MSKGVSRVGFLQRHLCSNLELPKVNRDEIDVEALRAKYDAERDKRLNFRPEGLAQYKRILDLAETDERFANMLKDPWVGRSIAPKDGPPEGLRDKVLVTIIGAGYGGLCAGARLRQAGIAAKDIRIVEQAADVGGTWYYNRYPGAMCDIEAYTYMPLCEDLGYTPTEKYAHQPELLHHSQLIAKKYGLYENAIFGRRVTNLEWDETEGCWIVRTHKGDEFRSRFVMMNFGTFTQPKLPAVPGVGSFKGHMFHTSRWDYEYTGGDPLGNLTNLKDKRVGIIGTGATSVQAIPHLAEGSKELYVFQRTPSSVGVRNNCETSPEFAREYLSKPGWQQERKDNFIMMTQTPTVGVEDLINDGWTDIMRNLQQIFLKERKEIKKSQDPSSMNSLEQVTRMMELADHEQMEKIRARVDTVVQDPTTAEALKPYYRQFCKRPCFHDEYLQSFNRDNVTLVDTNGLGIEAITENGIVANGIEIELDCIVFATGFETGYNSGGLGPQKVGYDMQGREGQLLSTKWEQGPRTFFSTTTHGFPNLFMQNAPQGAFCTNFVQPLDETAKHCSYIISECVKRGIKCVDPKKDKEDEYCQKVYDKSGIGQMFLQSCTPGYYNDEGQIKLGKTLRGGTPYHPLKLFNMWQEMREGDIVLDDFNVEFW